jgi:hypothetical protein
MASLTFSITLTNNICTILSIAFTDEETKLIEAAIGGLKMEQEMKAQGVEPALDSSLDETVE